MARTVNEIYDSIIAEMANYPSLTSLDSASNTAIYKLWAYISAVCMFVHETLWDKTKLEIEAIAARSVPGTSSWYAQRVLEFQYGDNLVFKDNVPTYDPKDESKKIIKRVAVVDVDGKVIVKAAKLISDVITPLTPAAELPALKAYLNKIRFAGTNVEVISLNADHLKLTLKVYYNALFDQAALQAKVEAAINKYLAELPFNGVLYSSKIVDVLQEIEGIIDIELTKAEYKVGTQPYAVIGRYYESLAGYIEIDPAIPLSGTITYLPSNV